MLPAFASSRVGGRGRMLVVVPANAWHRFRSPDGITMMTATPRPSEHVRLDVDDPRQFEPPRG